MGINSVVISRVLLNAVCFFVPIRLSITFIFLVPLLLLNIRRSFGVWNQYKTFLWLILYIFSCFVSSLLFSVDLTVSCKKLASFAFFACLIPVTAYHIKSRRDTLISLFFIGLGQTFTSLHSILESAFGLDRLFIGAVTESGQISMTAPVLLTVLLGSVDYGSSASRFCAIKSISFSLRGPFERFKLKRDKLGLKAKEQKIQRFKDATLHPKETVAAANRQEWRDHLSARKEKALGLLAFIFFLAASYNKTLCLTACALSLAGFVVACYRLCTDKVTLSQRHYGLFFIITLTSLLINVKRAPIIAAMAVTSAILVIFNKLTLRLIAIAALQIGAVVAFIPIIRERFISSIDHFLISGGRSDIWEIGIYILEHGTPLGYANSRYLHSFNESIPANLTHFHSNFLNILVEVGAIPMTILGYAFYILITRARGDKFLLSLSLSTFAIVIGGIFEYNLGDTEILLLLFLIFGIIEGERVSAERIKFANIPSPNVQPQHALKVVPSIEESENYPSREDPKTGLV